MRSSKLLLVSCACLLPLAASAADAIREVLPDTVVPTHYDLTVVPNARELTFTGTVRIAVAVDAPTRNVTLNAADLRFDRATADGTMQATTTYDPRLGRATLHFPSVLPAGRHTVAIEYRGRIGRETLGFFAMDSKTAGEPRRTLLTNFEPSSARKLLPCWDEPARKATFTVSVEIPMHQTAVSNMPIAAATPIAGGLERVTFRETPKMSTYLLFLGIGDFVRVHRIVDGVDVGVVVDRGAAPKAAHALGEAGNLLHFYDEYFGVRFPLPKLDLIAAPGEIEGGSMENWGAILYSPQDLLLVPGKSTEADRQLVFMVVAHEMSHQWFGDLVTMAWWDNLWLNEGFARWMQTYAADALHPQWETGLQAQAIFERGKRADALPSTHAVLQPVLTADQAEEAFDDITYDKGAAIITMLNRYIGEDTFREGIRRYMRQHAFGNTVDTDLWSIMQQVAGKPILKIERDFTREPGLPLIRVAATQRGVSLAEGRFHATFDGERSDGDQNDGAQRWVIPLPVAPPGQPERTLLLNGTAMLDVQPPVLVDAGETAYARVLYPDAAFAPLLSRVGTLSAVDQIGLINDALALGLAGYAPASRVLALAMRVPAAADPPVWERIIGVLTGLDRRYAGRPERGTFRKFALALLDPLTARLRNSPQASDAANVAVLRNQLIEARGEFGDSAVVARAKQRLAANSGDMAERRAVLAVAAEHASASEFEMLLARARTSDDPLEKLHIYEALGTVENAALAERMIGIAIGGEMPTGVNFDVLTGLAQDHPDLVWDAAVPRLAEPSAAIAKTARWRLAMTIARLSSDPHRIAQLRAYAARNVPPAARSPFRGAIAGIRQNVRIAQRVLPELDTYIASHPIH